MEAAALVYFVCATLSIKQRSKHGHQAAGTKHRSQVIVLLTQKVSQTPLKANLSPNKFLFRPN